LDKHEVDIAVIGAGPGGYVAGLRAAGLGVSVAVIEKDQVGGTCLNRGCIPTKAMLTSTMLLRQISQAGEFGLQVGSVGFDAAAIGSRARGIAATMRKGVEDLLSRENVLLLQGEGRFRSGSEIEVAGKGGTATLRFKAAIVATGSDWIELPGIAVDGQRVITSDHAFSLDNIPKSIAIIGGGAVGCEFAEIYSALGAETTLVEMMPNLLPGEDAELAKRLAAVLKRKGIKVATSTRVTGLEQPGSLLGLMTEGGSAIEAAQVMVAVGRKPYTEGLNLETVGLKSGAKGIHTDERLETGVKGIYAIGDVTGKYLLAHVASAQGLVAAENAAGGKAEIDYTAVPRCVYTQPEYAAVGMNAEEAVEAGLKARAYKVHLGRVGRALTLGETFGLAKMTCLEDGRVVGFHLLAPHASELVTEISAAITAGMSAGEIARIIHPHPTMSEIVWEAAQVAAGRPLHG